MKTPFLFLASLALACAPLCGQDANTAPKPSAAAVNITPEQRAKLKEAYQKGMQDPKVLAVRKLAKQAWDDYRAVVKKKVLADDPSMQPLFDKIDKAVENDASGTTALALTDGEKQKLHDAFLKAGADPAVKEALAKSDETKKATNAAMRAAILQADPSLEPVLDEIDRSKQASGGQ